MISRLHVLSAVYKAITAQVGGSMKTSNIHSEIVYSLSPTNNVSQFLPSFALSFYCPPSLPKRSRRKKGTIHPPLMYHGCLSGHRMPHRLQARLRISNNTM